MDWRQIAISVLISVLVAVIADQVLQYVRGKKCECNG